jgi:hypothetical protein
VKSRILGRREREGEERQKEKGKRQTAKGKRQGTVSEVRERLMVPKVREGSVISEERDRSTGSGSAFWSDVERRVEIGSAIAISPA